MKKSRVEGRGSRGRSTGIGNNRFLPTVAVIMACLLAAAFVLAAQPPGAPEVTDKGSRNLPETQRGDGLLPTPPASVDRAPELTAKASQAIDKGLKYLLANQRADGSWASTEAGDRAVAICSLTPGLGEGESVSAVFPLGLSREKM